LLGALRMRERWGTTAGTGRLLRLVAVFGLLFAQMALLTAAEPRGLANVARRVQSPSYTSYDTVARRVEDPVRFLRRYHEIQATFPVHGPSQPPGRVLYFWAVRQAVGAERAPAVAGYLLMVLGALSIVPLLVLVGGRGAPGAAGTTVALMASLPSYLLFTPQTDHLLLVVSLGAAALLVEAMRYASQPRAAALAFGAGLAAGLGVFVSFTTLAALGAWGLALAGMLLLAHRRGVPFPTSRQALRIAGAGLAGFALVIGATAALGLNWPAVFRESLAAAHRVQVEQHGRTYGTWVGWNLWDFALFVGFPLTLAWLARVRAEWLEPVEIPFAGALLISVLALDLSGRILGETGRIWMFLMPLAVAAAASGMERAPRRAVVLLAGSQFLVLLALRAFLNVPG